MYIYAQAFANYTYILLGKHNFQSDLGGSWVVTCRGFSLHNVTNYEADSDS